MYELRLFLSSSFPSFPRKTNKQSLISLRKTLRFPSFLSIPVSSNLLKPLFFSKNKSGFYKLFLKQTVKPAMNDLLSKSFYGSPTPEASPNQHVIQMTQPSSSADHLGEFFKDVETINDELKELEKLNAELSSSHEQSKTLHKAKAVKELRAKMDSDVNMALKKAKVIKTRLEALDQSNEASRNKPGCGPGSSSDRTRTSVVSGLRKKLKDSMESFNGLRETISSQYRETVQRRYFTVTGENPDDRTLDLLISTGESETFMQKAIQEQGRGRILDTINEIQERHDAVKDLEKNLKELHQVFLDMAVLVQTQGEELDDIENQVNRANSFVRDGATRLQTARNYQKNTRKWTCYAIILLLIIILFVVLFVIRPW